MIFSNSEFALFGLFPITLNLPKIAALKVSSKKLTCTAYSPSVDTAVNTTTQ